MDTRSSTFDGWVGYSAVVLFIGGVSALISGLMAVYKAEFFASDAIFAFSDLETWGWIVFGLGVAGIVAGLGVLTGRESARYFGVLVAGLGVLGQLLFAQAYPIWSLMIGAVYFLAIYGLLAHPARETAAAASSSYDERSESTGQTSESPSDIPSLSKHSRRAA